MLLNRRACAHCWPEVLVPLSAAAAAAAAPPLPAQTLSARRGHTRLAGQRAHLCGHQAERDLDKGSWQTAHGGAGTIKPSGANALIVVVVVAAWRLARRFGRGERLWPAKVARSAGGGRRLRWAAAAARLPVARAKVPKFSAGIPVCLKRRRKPLSPSAGVRALTSLRAGHSTITPRDQTSELPQTPPASPEIPLSPLAGKTCCSRQSSEVSAAREGGAERLSGRLWRRRGARGQICAQIRAQLDPSINRPPIQPRLAELATAAASSHTEGYKRNQRLARREQQL